MSTTDDETTPKKKKGGRRHKVKGSNFERELADYLNQALFPHLTPRQIHRTPLSGSFSPIKHVGSADLTGTPCIWVEAKRTEKCKPHEYMAQAAYGCAMHGNADMPVVITRRNRQPLDESLVIMRLSDFTKLYHPYLQLNGYNVTTKLTLPIDTPPTPDVPSPQKQTTISPSTTPAALQPKLDGKFPPTFN